MKSGRLFLLAFALVLSGGFPATAGTFEQSGGATAYTEQGTPVVIAPTATLPEDDPAQNYAGGNLTVSVGSAANDEQLGVTRVTTADTTAGTISVVGDFVHRGTGSGTEIIGAVNGVKNGVDGKDLVINFSQGFTNGDFEDSTATTNGTEVSLSGWTVYLQRLLMSDTGFTGTTVAGYPTPVDTAYPGNIPVSKDRASTSNIYTYSNTYPGQSGSGKALQLSTDGDCSAGYCVIRGPYVVSNGAVSLAPGDDVSFYWTALGASDAYDVYGYLLNTVDGSTIELINATGANGSATQAWTQVTKRIGATQGGTYKFVFVAGTWDASGGRAEGASLVIDDVEVTAASQLSVSAADVQQLSRLITYSQTGDNPAVERTVSFTTNRGVTTETFSQTINVTQVDDRPKITPVTIVYLTNGGTGDKVGSLNADDVDSTGTLVYGIQGVTPVDGSAYAAGSYGELYINTSTGAYRYMLIANEMPTVNAGTVLTESFTITAQRGTDPANTSTFVVRFSAPPTISTVSPSSGPITGGTQVTITGTDLGGVTAVEFGGTVGTNLIINSTTEVVVTTPAKSLGSVDVVLKSGTATGFTLSSGFTYANLTAPGAPTNAAVTRFDDSFIVTYAAPSSGGAVSSYTVEYTASGGTPQTKNCLTALTCTITGLTADTAYSVVVKAVNAAGTGSSSAINTRTLAVAPTLPTVDLPPAAILTVPVSAGDSAGVRTVVSGGVAQDFTQNVIANPNGDETGLELRTTVPTNSGSTIDVTAALQAVDPTGTPMPLAADSTLRMQKGLGADVSGAGFKPGTDAQVWLFSTPTLLGTFTVDGNGQFVGTVPVPVVLEDGVHALQLTGLTVANDLLTMAVGISVYSPPTPDPLLPLGRPVIKGAVEVGQTITCIAPAFDRPVTSYSLWFRVGGQASAPVTGVPAPVPSLVVTADMVGKSIECVVFAQTSGATSTVTLATAKVTAASSVPAGPGTPTTPTPAKATVVSVPFAAAKSALSTSARTTLNRMSLAGVKAITVTGFARKGSSLKDQKTLPMARAKAVVTVLKSRGFKGSIRILTAVGSTGTSRDRRVEVRLNR